MGRGMLTLAEAAAHVHLDVNELRHFAQRGEIAATERDGEWRFDHRTLDEWAQRNLLAASGRELAAQHRVMVDEERRAAGESRGVAVLLDAQAIELELASRAKAGVLRDLADLAERSGRVYDPEELHRALVDREAAASTALAGGVALPHPRFHDPYLFEETFIAYARSPRGVFFGAGDDEVTRHFFLVCSTDHERHLHILARLAMLVRNTDLLARLDAAEDADGVRAAVAACEEGLEC